MFLFSFSNYVHQRGYCWGELYKGALYFLIILLFNLVISICLDYLKLNLNFMFALNFNILYLFEFFILTQDVRNDKRNKVIKHDS